MLTVNRENERSGPGRGQSGRGTGRFYAWLLSALMLLAGAGCAPDEFIWDFRLVDSDNVLQMDTVYLVAELRRGDCEAGEPVYCEPFRLESDETLTPVPSGNVIEAGHMEDGAYCPVGFALNAIGEVIGRSWAFHPTGGQPYVFDVPGSGPTSPVRITPVSSGISELVSGVPSCGLGLGGQ